MAKRDPWARQEGETSKAYEAFCAYRDAGAQRTLRSVGEELGKSHTIISRWAAQHGWVDRAAAWDSMPAATVVEAFEAQAKRIAAQHDRIASKLMTRLERNLDLLPEGTDPSIKWSTAHGAARQGHSLAVDLVRPKDTVREEISQKITDLIERLAGE